MKTDVEDHEVNLLDRNEVDPKNKLFKYDEVAKIFNK